MKISQNFSVSYSYDVQFTKDLFDLNNEMLLEALSSDVQKQIIKVAFVIDKGLNDCHPLLIGRIENYIKRLDGIMLAAPPLVVKGGEQAKNTTEEFNKTLSLINQAKIDRHSYLVAIGGGAVLDMAGFAAAVSHRGIRHIRIPTTVLSQNDSGVGVKNGINYFGKKNFIGTFTPPVAVLNDISFLTTLNDRDWRSGIAEAVKVALIKDSKFFDWLENNTPQINNRDLDAMQKLICQCALLHSQHISSGNDPFELGSSRPLDFGHWSAHKLEQLTKFELKHGEAVAIGMALDVVYAQQIGLLDDDSHDRIIKLLGDFGFELFHSQLLDSNASAINSELIKGLEEFREHLGGELTITLIEGIGQQIEIHEMSAQVIEQAALILKQKRQLHAY